MKKLSLLLLGFLITGSSLFGQACEMYDAYKEGSSFKMVSYDKKDKMTGFTVTTIKEKKLKGDTLTIVLHQKYDNNDDYTFESEFSMKCSGGNIIIDMSKMIDPSSMTAYEGMKMDVSADKLTIPKNASPGDQLDDGGVTVTIDTGTPMKVTSTVTLSNRKVESKEKVSTPAGDFDCLKISYNILTTVGFIKIRSSTVEYYNRENGVVRSESYDKKGKLQGYSVIEEINL